MNKDLHLVDIVTINTCGCTLVPRAFCAIVERCMYKTMQPAGSGIKCSRW